MGDSKIYLGKTGKKTPKTPITKKRKISITSPLPSINNVPHPGNLPSADAFAINCRRRGDDAIYACATDGFGTTTSSPPKPFDFSSDSPPKPSLTSDQIEHSSQALKLLRDKIQNRSKIRNEFKQIEKINMRKSCKVGVQDGNLRKNRYPNVLPFDEHRVVLKDCKGRGSDYINASFIKVDASARISEFIATQGPQPNTFEDFWEMVIQYHCPVIVMLTELIDDEDIVKCGDYFQGDGMKEFGTVCVSTKWTRTTDCSLVLRCLEVKHKNSDEPGHSVIHVQYLNWPDHGVPADTLAVREILKMIYHVPPSLGPIVVHCSAGIGRTGAFCAIVNTVQRVLDGKLSALDLVSTISSFRSQRVGMVQSKGQYRFCYDAIIDELEDLIADTEFI